MGIGTSAEGLVVAAAVPPGCTELAASSSRNQAFLAQLLVLGIFKNFWQPILVVQPLSCQNG